MEKLLSLYEKEKSSCLLQMGQDSVMSQMNHHVIAQLVNDTGQYCHLVTHFGISVYVL